MFHKLLIKIAKFVLYNSELFMRILSGRPSDIKMLEELKLVTSLLCKLAPFGKLNK